ncbi:hypothetical protein A6770_01760 [Nostoc minutum NIES-26]|uniref:Uncharacterized protein n=1 Tax=Nostoc minutum NIES-26 TaxID=1844469 RepID=A0A367QS53_9NOSO|nr:hypothetical protein A6770_01760 [Nostoc minutum NIES-26]
MQCGDWGLGTGDWRLGIGDWGLGIGKNPSQSLIPDSQYPHLQCSHSALNSHQLTVISQHLKVF